MIAPVRVAAPTVLRLDAPGQTLLRVDRVEKLFARGAFSTEVLNDANFRIERAATGAPWEQSR